MSSNSGPARTTRPRPANRYPLRTMGLMTLTSTAELDSRFVTVSGERMSANAMLESPLRIRDPLGDMLGAFSGETVATNPSRSFSINCAISSVILAIVCHRMKSAI